MGGHGQHLRRWRHARHCDHPPEKEKQEAPTHEAEPSGITSCWWDTWLDGCVGKGEREESLSNEERHKRLDEIEAEERRVADEKRWAKNAAARVATALVQSVDCLPIIREDGLVRYDRERSQMLTSGTRAVVFHGRKEVVRIPSRREMFAPQESNGSSPTTVLKCHLFYTESEYKDMTVLDEKDLAEMKEMKEIELALAQRRKDRDLPATRRSLFHC